MYTVSCFLGLLIAERCPYGEVRVEGKKCMKRRLLEESCEYDEQCGRDAECCQGVCTCTANLINHRGSCYDKMCKTLPAHTNSNKARLLCFYSKSKF